LFAALTFVVYYAGSIAAGGAGSPLMPLDDAYIHFQYARQIAAGQFYVYNPGLPPTSGATSFLYPYLLAIGHLIGFHHLSLGVWAMALGALALAFAAYVGYQIVIALHVDRRLAWVVPPIFILHGLIAWHFMSGMETGFAVLFMLWTLYGVVAQRTGVTIAGATLAALIRPEGAILAVLVVIVTALRLRRVSAWHLLPLLAIGVQPLVNLVLTGSTVASGNAAKSLFGMIPFDLGVVIGRIVENGVRLWRDLLTPRLLWDDTLLGMFMIAWLALIGVIALLRAREQRGIGALLIVWGGAFALAIATLDTAFWHFRRYQLPLIAFAFPLSIYGLSAVWRGLSSHLPNVVVWLLVAFPLIGALLTGNGMLRAYLVNVGYVRDQPLAMARWLRENTPEDAVIAVHDVGMMRYMGGRTTLDLVGLTTPGAADYWRNGPGAIGTFLDRMRPDYIASYGAGHGLGLGFLQDTALYGEPLATFSVTLDHTVNVALAADTQGVYRPDYTAADAARLPRALPQISAYLDGWTLRDTIDVADVTAEREHGYQWENSRPLDGFPSEYYDFSTIGCRESCLVMEGGRRINGEESFILSVTPNQEAILVTRLHPADRGTFDVYANGVLVGTRVIPPLAGAFLEIPTRISAESISSDRLSVRIVPRGNADYMPYTHWLYQGGTFPSTTSTDRWQAAYQEGAIQLARADVRLDARDLILTLHWHTDSGAAGEYKFFVHILGADDTIVAQHDAYPGNGALPPGNWLLGDLVDTISISRGDLPPGRYRVMIGLYDPVTFARLTPFNADQTQAGDGQDRFLITEVEIP
jgi:hypothetical protein